MGLMVKKGIRAILEHRAYKEKKARKAKPVLRVFRVCKDHGESRESPGKKGMLVLTERLVISI